MHSAGRGDFFGLLRLGQVPQPPPACHPVVALCALSDRLLPLDVLVGVPAHLTDRQGTQPDGQGRSDVGRPPGGLLGDFPGSGFVLLPNLLGGL